MRGHVLNDDPRTGDRYCIRCRLPVRRIPEPTWRCWGVLQPVVSLVRLFRSAVG
jgi:hypothetical protein